MLTKTRFGWLVVMALLLTGCATNPGAYDYTAFKESNPRSILVLPPVNKSPEILASYGMLSQVSYPIAESGYYVLPVAVVSETLKQNGMTVADEAHGIPLAKLHEIFGADSVLYMTIEDYGTSYRVISSDTTVSASAKLVDGKTGTLLWEGSARVSTAANNSGGGLLGALLTAVIDQVAATVSDRSYGVAGQTSAQLLRAGGPRGMLYGPRSERFAAQ